MPLHYCPQCGSKLQPGFKFCPSCGEKLPSLEVLPESTRSEVAEEPDAVWKLSSQVEGLLSTAPVLTATGTRTCTGTLYCIITHLMSLHSVVFSSGSLPCSAFYTATGNVYY